MDNNVGELIANSFWATVGAFLIGLCDAMLANPLPYVIIGGVILVGVLVPARRTRRRRRY